MAERGTHGGGSIDARGDVERQPTRDSEPGHARVLVIDDEPAVGRTVKRLLGEQHDVTVLTDGKQAIELLARDTAYDVILCDLTMPGVSGIDVYHAAVRAEPKVASTFVFMTGGTFTALARQFLDELPNERLDKPFDVESVRELVRGRVH